MKQHPILFSTAMVQAILAGRKTQTRRIMKPQVEPCNHKAFTYAPWKDDPTNFIESFSDKGYWYCELCGNGTGNSNEFKGIKFPYGQVGHVLYVRETWRKYCFVDSMGYTHFDQEIIEYAADNPGMIYLVDGDGARMYNKDGTEKFVPWRPSIHMPKSACRLYLQITDIRVERLNEINEEDAKVEGILSYNDSALGMRYKDYMADASGYGDPDHDYPTTGDPIASFGTLWGSINGPDSWRANPFVWVISFQKIDLDLFVSVFRLLWFLLGKQMRVQVCAR